MSMSEESGNALTEAFGNLASALDERNELDSKRVGVERLRNRLVVVLVIVGTIATAVLLTTAFRNRSILTRVDKLSRLSATVTGCIDADSPDVCRKRLSDAATAEGQRRIQQVDCITRRALAGMSAPIPPDNCTSQTPLNIYPGGTP